VKDWPNSRAYDSEELEIRATMASEHTKACECLVCEEVNEDRQPRLFARWWKDLPTGMRNDVHELD
jgi:hypothetical protein